VAALVRSGFKWIMMGDFNCLADEEAVGELVAGGGAFCLDDAFTGQLPISTRPGSSRRIDYGLASATIFATRRDQGPGVSDHDFVLYGFDSLTEPAGFAPPRRQRVRVDGGPVESRAFEEAWDQRAFDEDLAERRVSDAWTKLSDIAEAILATDEAGGGKPRAAAWTPSRNHPVSKGAFASKETFETRRLRRLLRRLRQLDRRPDDDALRRVIHNGHQGFEKYPELAGMYGWNAECYVEAAQALVTQVAAGSREKGLLEWRAEMEMSPHKQRAWVTRRAALEAARELGPQPCEGGVVSRRAIHPAVLVHEAAEEWSAVWARMEGRDPEGLMHEHLQRVARPDPQPVDLEFTEAELLRAAKSMTHKAAGPDAWTTASWVLLPDLWWKQLAKLWTVVIKTAAIPTRWVEARVAFLRKPGGDTRPLSLTSVAWRLGAKVLVGKLRGWLSSWADHRLLGGLPGRAAVDVHLRLTAAMQDIDEEFTVMSQDISKFFDTIDVADAARVLRHLRAPEPIVKLLEVFYGSARKVFSIDGVFSKDWATQGRGVLQGCPFSPLLGAAVMSCWTASVCRSGSQCDGAVYVDDRSAWLCRGAPPGTLTVAKERGDAFDRVFGFTCRAEKCWVAARAPTQALTQELTSMGYGIARQDAPLVGLVHDLTGKQGPQLLKCDMSVLRKRLRLIRGVAASRRQRKHLIQSLVIPCLTWMAGCATAPEADLVELRDLALRAFGGAIPRDTTAPPLLEAMGWDADPKMCSSWASLRAAIRYHSDPPIWTEHCGVEVAAKKWFQLLTGARAVLRREGWWTDAAGEFIYRRDGYNVQRVFELGRDNPKVLWDWLCDCFRRRALQRCGRLNRSFHRGDAPEDTARGLDLPRGDATLVSFRGNARVFNDAAGDKDGWQAALATGCSVWFNNAGLKPQPQRGDPRARCLCGKWLPSRAHLLWNCTGTADLMQGVAWPTDRIGERLTAAVVDEVPAPPPVLDPGDAVAELGDLLAEVLTVQEVLFVATDGSSTDGVAAWAAHVAGVDKTVAAGVPGEDQTPYRAEVEALRAVLVAAELAVAGGIAVATKKLVLVGDCQAALQGARTGGGTCSVLLRELRASGQRLMRGGLELDFAWVPSHGKVLRAWCPHPQASEVQMRAWNAKADWAAGQCAARRRNGSARQTCLRARRRAEEWEAEVARRAALVAVRYRDFLANL
jgi:hypothetical protein